MRKAIPNRKHITLTTAPRENPKMIQVAVGILTRRISTAYKAALAHNTTGKSVIFPSMKQSIHPLRQPPFHSGHIKALKRKKPIGNSTPKNDRNSAERNRSHDLFASAGGTAMQIST